MCVLILGGTSEAKTLALQLHKQLAAKNIDVIYSIAGLVRQPELPCQIVSGGFRQFGGLTAFIQQHAVAAILDATHPFATTMSNTAASAAQACGIAYWAYQRPLWHSEKGDDWHSFEDWSSLLSALKDKRSVMLTAGQMQATHFQQLSRFSAQKQLLRTAIEPALSLPESMSYIKGIGPFALADELALMQQHQVDVLVSKMSGGKATVAKLLAARSLAIPVYFLAQPKAPKADKVFNDIDVCTASLVQQFV